MKYKDGTEVKSGDLISWNVWDNEDFTNWRFIGLYKKHSNHVVYLGGGIDFGIAIGQEMSISEVVDQSENNDEPMRGIVKLGEAIDAVRKLQEMLPC